MSATFDGEQVLASVTDLKTAPVPAARKPNGAKVRMTGQQRREQLLNVGRKLFAEKGFRSGNG